MSAVDTQILPDAYRQEDLPVRDEGDQDGKEDTEAPEAGTIQGTGSENTPSKTDEEE